MVLGRSTSLVAEKDSSQPEGTDSEQEWILVSAEQEENFTSLSPPLPQQVQPYWESVESGEEDYSESEPEQPPRASTSSPRPPSPQAFYQRPASQLTGTTTRLEEENQVLARLPRNPTRPPPRPTLRKVAYLVIKYLRLRWLWAKVGQWLKSTKKDGVQTRPVEGTLWAHLGHALQVFYGNRLFDLVVRKKGKLRYKDSKKENDFKRRFQQQRKNRSQ